MLQRDKLIRLNGRDLEVNNYVIAQVPNLPLVIALLAVVASRLLSEGSTAYFVSRVVFFVGLTVWAYLELADGVNGFRRLLGAGALAWIVFTLQGELS